MLFRLHHTSNKQKALVQISLNKAGSREKAIEILWKTAKEIHKGKDPYEARNMFLDNDVKRKETKSTTKDAKSTTNPNAKRITKKTLQEDSDDELGLSMQSWFDCAA